MASTREAGREDVVTVELELRTHATPPPIGQISVVVLIMDSVVTLVREPVCVTVATRVAVIEALLLEAKTRSSTGCRKAENRLVWASGTRN